MSRTLCPIPDLDIAAEISPLDPARTDNPSADFQSSVPDRRDGSATQAASDAV